MCPGRQSHSPVTWWQRYDWPQDGHDMLHWSPYVPALHSGRQRDEEWAKADSKSSTHLAFFFFFLLADSNTHCSDRWLPSSLGDTHMLQFPLSTCHCWGNAWNRSGYSGGPTGPLNTARCSENLERGEKEKQRRPMLSVVWDVLIPFTQERLEIPQWGYKPVLYKH